VLRPVPGVLCVVKDLVVVGIDHDGFKVGFSHETVEGAQWLEAVRDDEGET